ncbi:hypothetical protein GSI_15368 [Ganoderma sinense ZZ0214-1]|uniref:F-box domain-containing protein n=1 Tax=Ganoderma sinense ZZ0214-1 TaxID=1077348 RepID=A0A2G8RMD3_9APHY|nr:hypothetical protein GSI_15368 [Ganoderma sinense ZZ0214-1]
MPLTPDAIKFLVQLPTLRELSICLPDGVDWLTVEQVSQPVAALTEISLFTTIQAYTDFAQAIALPHAEVLSLWLVMHVPVDPDSIVPFFTALRRQLSPASLRSLTIKWNSIAGIVEARASQVVLRPSHLRPLLDFTTMEHFNLALVCKSALDAAFLRDVARAWPRLTYLSLLCDRRCTPHSLPPLNALAPFAIHCPDLHTLRVVVYAASGRQEDVDLSEFGGRASTSKLVVLKVGASPISDPATVAVTIARMFPSLVRVGRILPGGFPEGTDPRGKFQAGWNDVSRQYLPMFALVRQDERIRIAQEDGERGGGYIGSLNSMHKVDLCISEGATFLGTE